MMAPAPIPAAVAYDAYMGRWSRLVAHEFIVWLAPPPGLRWLDVGCGTGALSEAIVSIASPAEVCGVDPFEEGVAHARAMLTAGKCRFFVGDAQALPPHLAEFDATVSGLVLNLIPDPAAGLAEMTRVTRPGGMVSAYVWDFAEGMEFVRYLWDAAVTIDPGARELDQANCFPICRPDRLQDLFEGAGLNAVTVRPLEVPTVFRNFDDYWTPLLSGHGRVPGYVMSLTGELRADLRERLRKALPAARDGSIPLSARAWAVRGMKPGWNARAA